METNLGYVAAWYYHYSIFQISSVATFIIGCIHPIWGVFFGTKSLVLLRTGLPIQNIPVLRTQHGCIYRPWWVTFSPWDIHRQRRVSKRNAYPRTARSKWSIHQGGKKQKDELLPGFEPGSREDSDKPIKIPDANLYTTRARIRHSRGIFDPVKQYSSMTNYRLGCSKSS